ncbi:hypothetical protein OB2597_15420 [Pseudooceanicola batsensis HTCC2597]|uniref:Polyphosphate kinase n=1 Tax=Pseudooceanicola batsensis (strain ATCC BAA-863 / DSM 15984 / KCTC 12145 / HTCC2597) TaxID=252305 RepID=A3TYW6_PSEBH|nr:DUF1007 family protein [Pseudooceanicola batsensis]EAQ02784.1 hypothetical protein OB2597_15420 [Pseudooceanicola batsensis HTCC2597]
MIRRALPLLALLGTALSAGGLGAHPHVFVDTGLTLHLDDEARIEAVDVTWAYDEFYSLLVLQDMGLDPDADGVLTPDELRQVEGWDMKWVEGYEGDLYLEGPQDGAVALGPPVPLETRVVEGRLISVHRRPVEPAADAATAVLQAYDPEFYTAYDLTLGVRIAGDAANPLCTVNIDKPDENEAYREARDVMKDFPEDAVGVPLLGHVFAETVTLTCQPAG